MGEDRARLDTNGANWQRDRLNQCIRTTDKVQILLAGIAIGVLVVWGMA